MILFNWLQELSSHLSPKNAAALTDEVRKALLVCPYGVLLSDIPPTTTAVASDGCADNSTDLNMHEEYGRYLCSVLANDVEICNTNNPNSGNHWSVPWLDALPLRAARSVQIIDAKLRELRTMYGNLAHRQDVIFGMCAGTTKCVVYNNIMRELYDKGSTISCASLQYWIVYSMYALYSATQAVQFTYTMLATHSIEDFMSSGNQVSLYVYALRDVLTDVGDNLPVGGSIDRVQLYFDSALSKLVSAV